MMVHLPFKVEPYPIPGSFLKLKYLKIELNVDQNRVLSGIFLQNSKFAFYLP